MPKIINDKGVTRVGVGKDKNKTKASNKINSAQPTFFHEILTGRGGTTRGLLNDAFDPKNYPHGYPAKLPNTSDLKVVTNGNLKVITIPFYIIPPHYWGLIIKTSDVPDLSNLTCIATKNNHKVYIDMHTNIIQVEKEKIPSVINSTTTSNTTVTRLSANFEIFLYGVNNPASTKCEYAANVGNLSASVNTYTETVTCDIFDELKDIAAKLTSAGYDVNKTALDDYVQNFSLYVDICKLAETWETKTDYYVADLLAKNQAQANSNNTYVIEDTVSQLERYNVPLDSFHTMYNKLSTIFPLDVLTRICKSHLNLRLSNTLHTMDINRAQLKSCPDTNKSVINSTTNGHSYSFEQRNAIASTSPLTLVQSGAGTGKSTIILARIQHMIANGIDPSKILVLSFTNAAADHILDMNPDVKSMTIDAMMRKIYNYNFPNHELSTISTIINSLEIFYSTSSGVVTPNKASFIRDFTYVLNRLRTKKAYTETMNFVEENLDEVIDALNTIEQTSLELQGIICYFKLNSFVEPPEFDVEHMIIDEVQDNSIFQFIYSIEYTNTHKNSLYIVGDCSQTLYEFRASNPKALNTLEGSGVFQTYKLQTNYRSKQEILDFANIALSNIEANRYAQIQLKANDLTPVSVDSFKQAVRVVYKSLLKKPTYDKDTLKALCSSAIISAKEYIEEKFNKGEQVTILAYKRDVAKAVSEMLEKQFPTVTKIDPVTKQPVLDASGNPVKEPIRIVSLISSKQYDNTDFSRFILYYWNQIKFAPHTNIMNTIEREFYASLNSLASNNISTAKKTVMLNTARTRMDKFISTHSSHINELQKDVAMSNMTTAQMLSEIKKMMISFEIKENAILQAVITNKNEEKKLKENVKNAHVIMSTIHGAKGLEFDNVLLMYDGSSDEKMSEESKRMYYVALTRAKNSEFIVAYDTIKLKPKIVKDHERIVALLTKQAAALAAAPADDSDNDDDSNDSSGSAETDIETDSNDLVTTSVQNTGTDG